MTACFHSMRSRRPIALLVIAICAAHCGRAAAYNPPVDRAGPLSVRIEGPDEIDQPGELPIRVVMENSSEEPIEGRLDIGLIDGWRAEPDGPAKFRVEGKGRAAKAFRVAVDPESYSAHYPVHAFARFDLGGQSLVAHPVLMIRTQLPGPPQKTVPPEWKAAGVPADGRLALWQLGPQRAVVELFGQEPQVMPVGWQGSEAASRATLRFDEIALGGVRRGAVAMHPPWYEGRAGTMAVEFPLALPETKPIELRFATAVTPDHRGDGVTFRVRVLPFDGPAGKLGEVVFERHSDAKTWQPGEADLSAFAGRAIRLQLESHPGPRRDTGWDQSYWAEPMLSAGAPPKPPSFPPHGDAGSVLLGMAGPGGTSSSEAARAGGGYQVRVWPGRCGLLDATVGFRQGDKLLCFQGFEVRAAGLRLDRPGCPVALREATQEKVPGGVQVRHRFEGAGVAFDLVGRLVVERGVLRASFRLENAPPPKPWQVVYLEQVACGPWNRTARHVYAGHGNVVRDPQAYYLAFEGHRLATSFVGFDFDDAFSLVQAVDVPPDGLDVRPPERHYSLHVPHACTMTFIPSPNAFEAVKVWRDVNGLKPAGGVEKLAGRFAFDLWGGRYAESADALRRAFRYGLTDAVVVWHNWQRFGYDYRLPDIYPPNPQYGTFDEFRQLAETCKQAGVLFAPHDNYIDFYPDAEQFSYRKLIAFDRSGHPVRAWLNEGRGAQSYRYRADQVEPFLTRNLRLLRDGVGPTAYFIDVWSSIAPYDYWTADGRFVDRIATRDTWARQFAWIRDLLGDNAPQISESGHDQLVGYLDGAQTNHLRVGGPLPGRYSWSLWNWKCGDAERTPWLDAAHHDRFILHGAGYSSRYQAGLDANTHGIYSDDYMATEVLDGHPAMAPAAFGRDVVRKYWLLAAPMRALALRRIEAVEFAGGDLHRQHVTWSGGAEVWVNRGPGDWNVEGHVLPRYGFLVRVPDAPGTVEAALARRDGVITEWTRTPETLYVNGRMPGGGPRPIRAAAERFRDLGNRRFELTLAWQIDRPIPEGYRPFLHFCDAEGEIVFQAGVDPAVLTGGRTGRVETVVSGAVPENVAPGAALELRYGFYRPEGGQRIELVGPDDGTRRIRLGTLRLAGEGDQQGTLAWTALEAAPDAFMARQNPEGRPIDFGPVVTAGACRIAREQDALVLTPLPGEAPEFTVRLRWERLPWRLPAPRRVEELLEDGSRWASSPVRQEGGALVVRCRPGVFAYRLVSE